jgi:transcriptional regulator with XRE-family HTH domain
MPKTKVPTETDVYVGKRIRMRRMEQGMSQEALGNALGLTFQQVQKYEKGTNRVGASRLQQMSNTLEVPVAWFFEGAPGATGKRRPPESAFLGVLTTNDGIALCTAFAKIGDADVRRKVVRLVEELAA